MVVVGPACGALAGSGSGRRVKGGTGLTSGRRRTAAWLVLAPWAGWAAVRGLGLERGYPGVPLLALTPYVAALAVVPLAAALLLRQRAAVVAALAVAAVLVAGVAPRALPARGAPADGPELRVLTANLYYGDADPRALVELVRRERVDVLSVQELTPAAGDALERAGLSALLPHQHLAAESGASGSGLYARFPLEPLPQVPPGSAFAMPRAAVDVPGAAALEVVAVHPPPPIGPEGVRTWQRDLAGLPSAGTPAALRILAGDFNATLDHRELRQLLARGYRDAAAASGAGWAATWPGTGTRLPPPVTIDHVLVDRRATPIRVTVHDLPGSDHRPVLAEVGLARGAGEPGGEGADVLGELGRIEDVELRTDLGHEQGQHLEGLRTGAHQAGVLVDRFDHRDAGPDALGDPLGRGVQAHLGGVLVGRRRHPARHVGRDLVVG